MLQPTQFLAMPVRLFCCVNQSQWADDGLQGARQKPVVGVRKHDILTPDVQKRKLAGQDRTETPFVKRDMDPAVKIGVMLENIGRPVCGRIVDAEDLQVPERLGNDGVEAPFQERFFVVNGNDDGQLRHIMSFCQRVCLRWNGRCRFSRKTCLENRIA